MTPSKPKKSESPIDHQGFSRHAFEDAAIGMVLLAIKPMGKYLEVNRAFCEMTGYSRGELLKRDFQSITAPQDRDKNLEGVHILVKGSVPSLTFEKRYIRKDGSSFWARLHASLIRNAEKKPLYMIVQIEDIDLSKRAGEALRKSEASLAEAQRIAHLGNWDWDISRNTLWWSDEMCRIFGVDRHAFGAQYEAFINAVHPDDRGWVQKAVDASLYKDKPYDIVYRILRPDGGLKFIHAQGEVTFDHRKKAVRMAGTVQDITERKQAEDALRKSEERLQKQNKVLFDLTKSKTMGKSDLAADLREITEVASESLKVERVNIWLYNEDRTKIRCIEMYERTGNRHSKDQELAAVDFPAYFRAMEEARTIAAHDALTDPRTKEFSKPYLSPNNITSLLDAPIRVGGRMLGVLCHEQVGPARRWTLDEQYFAGSLADLISLVIENDARIRAEKALRQSETRFRTLIEQSPFSTQIFSPDGKTLKVNRAWEKLWGTTLKALGDYNILQDTQLAAGGLMPYIKKGFSGGSVAIPPILYDPQKIGKQGNKVWIQAYIYPVKDDQGGIREVVLMHEDITQRKEAEKNLHRQTLALHKLHSINMIPRLDEIKLCDEVVGAIAVLFSAPYVTVERIDGEELEIISMWQKDTLRHGMRMPFSGSPCANVIEEKEVCQYQGSLKELFPQNEFFSAHLIQAYLGSPIFSGEGRVVGVVHLMYETTRVFSQTDFQIMQLFGQIVGAFLDRQRLEKELQHAHKLEAVGQLAGGIAHEFNNLLTAIIGNINLALRPEADIQSVLATAEQAARRAAMLTRQLLMFSHRTPTDLKPLNLNTAMEEAIQHLNQTIDQQVELRAEPSHELWPVMADSSQIHQVITNLCINAREALMDRLAQKSDPEDSSRWQPLASVRTENVRLYKIFCRSRYDATPGDYVCLSVSDNGWGIDKNIESHIFEPFFTTKEAGQGTGLGLATAYGIAKQHNGWIELDRTETDRTTFKLYLPRTHHLVSSRKKHAAGDTVSETMETILFVDDEKSIRLLGQTILERQGYTVLQAEDGEHAIDLFKRERTRVGLVILDLTMPKQSGKDVLRQLRALEPKIKVIISTGHADLGEGNSFKKIGADGFVPKPYRSADLIHAVRSVLDAPDR